jgi:hypothetical protein
MQFGRNTNVTIGPATLHVQTEDRGVTSALLDTTVYFQGRILHRRINNYFDLLPLNTDTEQALKLRLDEQHRAVIDEIRSRQLQLPIPSAPVAATKPLGAAPTADGVLSLELANPKNWLAGKRASIQLAVHDAHGKAAAGAQVTLRIEGAAEPTEIVAVSGPEGIAQLDFEIPRLTGSEPALLMTATNGAAKGQLRFALRVKPRVPSA